MPGDVETEEPAGEKATGTQTEGDYEAGAGASPESEHETGEPGGADPNAVRARKEYRTRKKLERELSDANLRFARLEGELQGRDAAAQPARGEPEAPKYTEAEVLSAVTESRITAEQGSQYLKHIKDYDLGKVKRELLEEVDRRRTTGDAAALARNELADYIAAIPALQDTSSDEFARANAEYQRLTNLGGMKEDSLVKQIIAVKSAFGPLDAIRKRADQPSYERDQRGGAREIGGGGGRPSDGAGGSDEAKVRKIITQPQIDYWQNQKKSWKEMLEDSKHVGPRFRIDGGRQ